MNNTIPVSYHSSIAKYIASTRHLTLCPPYMGGTKPSAPADDDDGSDDDDDDDDAPYVPVQWPIPEEWARDPDKPRDSDGNLDYD